MKAETFDRLLAALDCALVQEDGIRLPDGRWLKLVRRNGEVLIQLIADPQTQGEIERARLRLLHGE